LCLEKAFTLTSGPATLLSVKAIQLHADSYKLSLTCSRVVFGVFIELDLKSYSRIITPYSPVKVNIGFNEKYRLHHQDLIRQTRKQHEAGRKDSFLLLACFNLGYFLTYSSTLKMEAIHSTETSVDFHWTAKHCIPEYRILLN
jgi:hypothetical protein